MRQVRYADELLNAYGFSADEAKGFHVVAAKGVKVSGVDAPFYLKWGGMEPEIETEDYCLRMGSVPFGFSDEGRGREIVPHPGNAAQRASPGRNLQDP